MTGTSVVARAATFFAPLPLLEATQSDAVVVFWLLILSFQSLASAISGALPTLSMQMLSYAFAGSERVSGSSADHLATRKQMPNLALIAQLNHFLLRAFQWLSVFFLLLAASVGTWVIWKQLNELPSLRSGLMMWGMLVTGTTLRLVGQPFLAYLLACGETALARRIETATWLLGLCLVVPILIVSESPVLGMLGLQFPAVLYWCALRIVCRRKGWRVPEPDESPGTDQNLVGIVWPRTWRGVVGSGTAMTTIFGGGFLFSQYGEASQVAAYLLAVNLLGLMGQVAISPLLGNLPAIASKYAKGESITEVANQIGKKVMWSFTAMCILAPVSFWVLNWLIPKPISFVAPTLWLLLSIAHLLLRYGSIHLNLYSVTNDIRWHTINSIYLALTIGPLLILDKPSVWIYPVVQSIAGLFFYAPYLRWLTKSKLGYALEQDIATVILPLLLLLAGLACCSFYLG